MTEQVDRELAKKEEDTDNAGNADGILGSASTDIVVNLLLNDSTFSLDQSVVGAVEEFHTKHSTPNDAEDSSKATDKESKGSKADLSWDSFNRDYLDWLKLNNWTNL